MTALAARIEDLKLLKWFQLAGFYLFWPAVALIVWGELTQTPIPLEAEISDKVLHFTAYFGLAGMVCLALKGERRVIPAILGLAVLGGALEVIQGYVGRDCSLYDELANIGGAVTGAVIGWAVLRLVRPKVLAASSAS